jgi:hypothetical protein
MDEIIGDIDPNAASLAFEALLARLDALTEIRATTTDLRKSLIHAASVGRMVQKPEVKAVFQTLPAERFDMQHVELLETASMATWHTVLMQRSASVLSTGAKVPDEILAQGTMVKERMFKVVDYVLGHVGGIREQLADIRGGKGHVDLADDLMREADLYEAHATALVEDRIHYKAEDAVTARKLAHGIYKVLGDGRSSDARYWSEYQARAWTFLLETYDEVAAAGRWLYRHENGEALFPSLYAVGRQPRRSRRAEGGEGDPGGEIPAGDDDGESGAP